jgi:Flp pilus assembly protein TadG
MDIINRPHKRIERGQSLAEFGVAMVVLLVLLAGVVDLGRLFLTAITMNDAAQEGTLIASICDARAGSCKTDMETAVKAVSGPVDLSTAALTISAAYNNTSSGHPCGGDSVTVNVQYTFDFTMPFINLIVGSQTLPMNIRSTATVLKPFCN